MQQTPTPCRAANTNTCHAVQYNASMICPRHKRVPRRSHGALTAAAPAVSATAPSIAAAAATAAVAAAKRGAVVSVAVAAGVFPLLLAQGGGAHDGARLGFVLVERDVVFSEGQAHGGCGVVFYATWRWCFMDQRFGGREASVCWQVCRQVCGECMLANAGKYFVCWQLYAGKCTSYAGLVCQRSESCQGEVAGRVDDLHDDQHGATLGFISPSSQADAALPSSNGPIPSIPRRVQWVSHV